MELPRFLQRRDTPAAIAGVLLLVTVLVAGYGLWRSPACDAVCRVVVVGAVLVSGMIAAMLVWHRLWNEFET